MEFMALWGLSDFVFNVLAGKFRNTFGPGWDGLGWAGLGWAGLGWAEVGWMVVWHERVSSLDTPPIYDQPSSHSLHLLVVSTLRSDITQIGPH